MEGNGRSTNLLGPARSRGYLPYHHYFAQRPRDLPPFGFDMIRSMLMDPAIRLGLAMRAAPISGVEIAYQDGDQWVPGVQAKRPEVAAFVLRQLKRIWAVGLDGLLSSQTWGWSSGEITYRLSAFKTVEIDRLLVRHAADTRALIRGGEVCGMRVLRVMNVPGGQVDLHFPKCWFHAHRPDCGMHYGTSILFGAYSPFADKWFHGGALDVRRLFMHKDAYGGADLTYPDGITQIGDEEVSNRDLALQIAEQLTAGGVSTRPAQFDDKGNEKWKLTRATVPANPGHILQFPKDLDTEIYHGLEIPDDVIESETGAWAGKRIPLAAFYAGLDSWVTSLLGDLKTQVLEPLVMLNIGRKEEFSVTHKPLAEQALEQQSQAAPGQKPGGQPNPFEQSTGQEQQQQPRRFGLDPELAVGHGVWNAAELVRAARKVSRLAFDESQVKRDEEGQFSTTGGGATKSEKQAKRKKPSKHPSEMSASEINQTMDKLESLDHQLSDEFITAGRGHERPSDWMEKSDPLALRAQSISKQQADLRYEIYRRTGKHQSRLSKGVGPIHRLAVAHAPVGGISIAGKKFKGGEFIPGEDLKKATAEQKRQIAGGKQAPTKGAPSAKVQRAKASAKRIAGDVQRYAEEHNEPRFSMNIGGVSFRDNEPVDIVVADDAGRVAHGIELKTMVDNKHSKITMKREAIRRKLSWSRRNKAAIHTVVIDDTAVFNALGQGQHDESKRRYFYRRGVGSFRVAGMYQAQTINELKQLLALPTRQLPEGAR